MKKSKMTTRAVQICALVLLLTTVLLQIKNIGTISNLSEELIYWERARLMIGQGGLIQYTGASLASIGYSLLLVPICLIIDSPYAAYKAAMLLCGFFYCVSYIVSVLTAKKIFPKENETFLSVACFFVMVCPIFTFARCFSGPACIALFFMWLMLYLLVNLWEGYSKERLVTLAVCLILMGFFQTSSIGAIAASIILLGIFVKYKKMDENTYLTFILCILICFVVGNFAERGILSKLYQEYEVEVTSSFEVLIDGISDGWKKDSFAGLLNSALGKLFVSAASSFLVACAGYWFIIRESVSWIKQKNSRDNYIVSCIVFLPFLIQFILCTLYSNSLATADGLTSMSNMEAFVLPVILLGIVQIKNSVHWEKELAGYVLFMCFGAFVIANVYQKNGVNSISKMNSSIMLVLDNGTRNPVAIVYMSACIAILVGVILAGCLKCNFNKQSINKCLKAAGAATTFGVCMFLNLFVLKNTAVDSNDYTMQYMAPIAALLSETESEADYYYIYGGGNDKNAVYIQSLVPEKTIKVINNNTKSRTDFFETAHKETKENVLITGTNESFIETTLGDDLDEYRLLYMTAKHAVWAYRGSDICQELDQAVCSRVESLELSDIELEELQTDELSTENETESAEKIGQSATHIYGGSAILAPGTYRLEVYFQKDKMDTDLEGTLSVLSDGEKISSKKISSDIFDEDDKGAVVIEFTSRTEMRKFEVTIKGTIAAGAEITDLYYWKQNSAYTVGLNGNVTKNTCDTILTLDELCSRIGTVAYVADIMTEKSDISVKCFEDRMPGYEVAVVSKEELKELNTDYLIGVTSSHSYFDAMEQYSIIKRNSYYTVLVRNDSKQHQKYLEEEGMLLSDGKEIKLTAFLGKDVSLTTPVALEKGSYSYRLKLLYDLENLTGSSSEVIGIISICDGEEILLEKALTKTEVIGDGSGETEMLIPFALRDKARELSCTFISERDALIEVIPQGIELTAEKYQFGQEEELEGFYNLISARTDSRCAVVLTEKEIEKGQTSYEFLQQKMPECKMKILSYKQANSLVEDTFLITYDFSKEYMQLLENYSILAHSGQYTLWVRSNGGFLQNAISAGAQVLSSGKKISPESIALAKGQNLQEDQSINLPKATYNVVVELNVEQLELDDTVEVILLRDKTEKEIQQEIEELVENGYSEKEAKKNIKAQEKCGSASYKAYQFDEIDSTLVSIRTSEKKIANMVVDVYSWFGYKIEGEIVWIELA